MKSEKPGTGTYPAEIANILAQGFWVFLGDRELFVPFQEFPWFADASVSTILNVRRPQEDHLYWPDLDVDLAVESLEHPERFPLVCEQSGRSFTGPFLRISAWRRGRRAAGGLTSNPMRRPGALGITTEEGHG